MTTLTVQTIKTNHTVANNVKTPRPTGVATFKIDDPALKVVDYFKLNFYK